MIRASQMSLSLSCLIFWRSAMRSTPHRPVSDLSYLGSWVKMLGLRLSYASGNPFSLLEFMMSFKVDIGTSLGSDGRASK